MHVALDTHIGTVVPPVSQGAVFALQRLAIGLVSLGGLGLVSGALHYTSPANTLGVAGLVMALAALAGWAL